MALFFVSLLVAALAVSTIEGGVLPQGEGNERAISSGGDLIYIGSMKHTVTGSGKSGGSVQQSLYFESTNEASWQKAASDCKVFLGETATLLYIETQEELGNVTDFLNREGSTAGEYWIGGQFKNGKFEWGNGVAFGPWAPWGAGQPNSQTAVTKVELRTLDVTFATAFQTAQNRYLCELTSGEQEEQPDPCYNDNDLVVVVDSSGSIGPTNYMVALEFTTRLALAWADNNGRNRLSVMVYSSSVATSIWLSDNLSASQIRDKVYSIQYLGGGTASNLGLDHALAEFTSNPRSVPKNLVFITDGASNSPSLTIAAAQRVQNAGIRSFAVGITNSVNPQELLAIAGGKSEHVFNTDGFDDLLKLLKPVSRRVCP